MKKTFFKKLKIDVFRAFYRFLVVFFLFVFILATSHLIRPTNTYFEHVQEYEAQMWTFENCWKSFFLNNFASVQYSDSRFSGEMDNHVTYDLSYFLYQNILLQQSLDKKVTLFHLYPTKHRHEKIKAYSHWNIASVVNVYWPYVTLHWVTLKNPKKG